MEYGEINIDSSLFVNYKVWSLSDEVVSSGRVMLPFCSVSLQLTQPIFSSEDLTSLVLS